MHDHTHVSSHPAQGGGGQHLPCELGLTQLLEQNQSVNGLARAAAIQSTVELANLIPPTVSYESQGDTLIIGPTAIIESAAEQLTMMGSVTLLSTDGEAGTHPSLYFTRSVRVSGFLGAFEVMIESQGGESNLAAATLGRSQFDIVLDLCLSSCMSEEVPVPGYYPVGRGYPKLTQALEEIPTLKGTFDKPKYFRLDTDLCAHSSRGVKGCERCVDACPAGALSSQGSEKTGHKIEINPFLCQGVGTCATSCPTEAIHYALPNPTQTHTFVERLLANYRKHNGQAPVLLFCSERHESYNVMAIKQLPDNVIPVELEEIASVGIDTWFAALSNGACQVLFAVSQHMPQTILRVLNSEIDTAQRFLAQLGIETSRIELLYIESLRSTTPRLITEPLSISLGEVIGNKRERLFSCLDALAQHYLPSQVIADVPAHAPYGQVKCDSTKCTSCMSCVAVCPTRALHTDGQSPSLQFVEQDCVQCGLCEKACPEGAIELEARMNWNQQERESAKIIHQEPAAKCLRCEKPFAPQSMIDMLQSRLQGHSHFTDQAAINRIAMCEDCRVVDMFESMANDPMQQLNY